MLGPPPFPTSRAGRAKKKATTTTSEERRRKQRQQQRKEKNASLTGVALRVLVGHDRPDGLHDRRAHKVLRRDELEALPLAVLLVLDDVDEGRVDFGERRVEEARPRDVLGRRVGGEARVGVGVGAGGVARLGGGLGGERGVLE